MKFNPFEWSDVSNEESFPVPRGRVRVMLSQASALYVAQEGVEALAGVNTEFNLELAAASVIRVEKDEGCKVFVAYKRAGSFNPQEAGELVFTNADRMVHESGAMQEVKRAVREMELAKRQTIREIRQAAADARAESAQLIEQAPAPKPAEKPAEKPADKPAEPDK